MTTASDDTMTPAQEAWFDYRKDYGSWHQPELSHRHSAFIAGYEAAEVIIASRATQEEFLAEAINDPEGQRLANAAKALATPGLGNWPAPNKPTTTTAPKRIQRQRTKGWRKPKDAVYVGRGNHWGNPYRTEEHGRQGAVDIYRADLANNWAGKGIYKKLRDELRGKDLMCWCPLDQPCHVDVLLELANKEPL